MRPEVEGASVACLRVSENSLASLVGAVQWVVGAYVRLHFLADSRVDSHGTRVKAAGVARHYQSDAAEAEHCAQMVPLCLLLVLRHLC